MRVVAGSARGIKLISIEGINTRPTLDRVKEAVFGSIQFKLLDACVLDLFSGSGALGIEALSRGAKKAVFVDKNAECINVINKNLKATHLQEKAIVVNADAFDAMARLKGKIFDFIFIDPPYAAGLYENILIKIREFAIIDKNSIIVLESNFKELDIPAGYEITKQKKYGQVYVTFVREEI